MEEFLIWFYGRSGIDPDGVLTNICDSARPPNARGKIRSTEFKEKHKGQSPFKGKKHSDETKKKISIAMTGANHPLYGKAVEPERAAKICASTRGRPVPNKGKPHSNKTKERMSSIKNGSGNPMFGRKHSEETKQKMREAAARRRSLLPGEFDSTIE